MLSIQQSGILKQNKVACINITTNDKQEHMLYFMSPLLELEVVWYMWYCRLELSFTRISCWSCSAKHPKVLQGEV